MKIGLVGWASTTGNGAMNSDIARLMPGIDRWLAVQHPKLGFHEPYLDVPCDVHRCRLSGQASRYTQFLDGLDVVLFVEMPYLRGWDLVGECRRRDIFTVCIPMWEWFNPRHSWARQVDMLWCVTEFTRKHVESLPQRSQSAWRDCIHGGPYGWGVDLEAFPFRERSHCETFLFANGNGGWGMRKGSSVIQEAAVHAPDIEIRMLTQGDNYANPMPGNVRVQRANYATRAEVYATGDVFLAPTHWEGFGHQLYEAQACGLPLVTTDAPPMNESGAAWLLSVSRREIIRINGTPATKVTADATHLAELMSEIRGQDIREHSRSARQHIEERHNLRAITRHLHDSITASL